MSNKDRILQNQNNQQLARVEQVTTRFSGLVPHPDILAGYEKVCPGAAERIIKMAENQTAHRIELEKIVIDSNNKKAQNGQVFAFAITIVAIIAGSIVAIIGKNTASYLLGGILSGGTIVSVVGLFLYGKRENRKERAERRLELLDEKKAK